jgi:regulator of RNase E activity RraA
MTTDILEEIINFLKINRVSTTEVADALGKTGGLSRVSALNRGHYAFGRVRHIKCFDGSNFEIHDNLDSLSVNDILLVDPSEYSDLAYVGDLIAKYTLLYKRAAGIIVKGHIRDTSRLIRENYPIWSYGSNPVGATNMKTRHLSSSNKGEFEGGIAICDDGGVVLIHPTQITDRTLTKLNQIELQESLWYYCLDILGWNTREIVCDKKYLNSSEQIPSELIKYLKVTSSE